MKKERKRVAIYIRVSTLDQAREGYSLDMQEKTLRKWCADHGCDVVDVYADRGISGKDIDHRPDMRRLLQDVKKQKFDTVLFWALSRFSRSVSDLYDTMELLQKYDVCMISYTESFDTSSPMGRAMIGIVGIFAQLERELTSERVFAALQERASQGKRTCSEVLGYDTDGKDSLRKNRKEGEYVLFCFNEYWKCKNLTEVAMAAREKGYCGKRGKIPTAYAVMVILMNPIYCGYNVFCGELYKGNHEPYVTEKEFNWTQTLLARQSKTTGGKMKKKFYRIK